MVAQMPPMTPQAPPEAPAQIIVQREEVSQVVLAAFASLGFALSARFLVFLSLAGAFVIAIMAMRAHDLMGLSVLALYCLLIVLPLIWLELNAKRPS